MQRTYGKQAGDLAAIAKVFMVALADYPPEDVIAALRSWLTQSAEFPTPYDIKCQLSPEQEPKRHIYQLIVATMRQGQYLDRWEWDYMRRYERENA